MLNEPLSVAVSSDPGPTNNAINREIEVLLHESSEIQENIRGNSDAMVKIGVFVMPLITGAYLLSLSSQNPIDKSFLAGIVCVVASFILITANGLWLHNLKFAEYKYCHVMPRLYLLSGRAEPNFGSFIAGRGFTLFLMNLVFSQLIVVSVVLVFLLDLLRKGPYSGLSAVVMLAVAFAIVSTVVTTLCGYSIARKVRRVGTAYAKLLSVDVVHGEPPLTVSSGQAGPALGSAAPSTHQEHTQPAGSPRPGRRKAR